MMIIIILQEIPFNEFSKDLLTIRWCRYDLVLICRCENFVGSYLISTCPPGPCLNIKTVFPGYRDSHNNDEMVVKPSYLYNGNLYTGKMASLYWDSAQVFSMLRACISNYFTFFSDLRQAIIWTSAGMMLIEPLGTNFSEILIKIETFSFKKIRLKILSAKCCPFHLGLNVLNLFSTSRFHEHMTLFAYFCGSNFWIHTQVLRSINIYYYPFCATLCWKHENTYLYFKFLVEMKFS